MNTSDADTGVNVTDKRDVFFSQIAACLEAVCDRWHFNAYGLFPIGDTEQRLNSHYDSGALHTYGVDVGYSITPDLNASVGITTKTVISVKSMVLVSKEGLPTTSAMV